MSSITQFNVSHFFSRGFHLFACTDIFLLKVYIHKVRTLVVDKIIYWIALS